MIVLAAAVGFSLFVTACLAGTLHGKPTQSCNEFQLRRYQTSSACLAADRKSIISDWLKGSARVGLDWKVTDVSCAPADPQGDDF